MRVTSCFSDSMWGKDESMKLVNTLSRGCIRENGENGVQDKD